MDKANAKRRQEREWRAIVTRANLLDNRGLAFAMTAIPPGRQRSQMQPEPGWCAEEMRRNKGVESSHDKLSR